MLKPKSFLHFTFFIIFLVFPFISVNSHEENDAVMFVFGDSVFDPGNNNYINVSIPHKANHWPYGKNFFNSPTGRYSDGRIIPDFIAMEMKLPLWNPYLGPNRTRIHSYKNGVNFASGGACVITPNHQEEKYINLKEQLMFFKDVAKELRQQQGEIEANRTLMNAIYWSSFGGVDYETFFEDYSNSSQSQPLEFVQLVMGNFTHMIKEIYEIGGRKFAFQNVGPMGCLPSIKQYYGLEGDKCAEGLLDLAKLHNSALLQTVAELETQLDGFKYSIFDYYTALYNIIQNHTQYGFEVVDSACCGQGPNRGINCGIEPYELCKNASEYLFFDEAHTTERANSILSQLMWNGESTLLIPYNFKQLYELNITSQHDISENHIGITMKNVRVQNNYDEDIK